MLDAGGSEWHSTNRGVSLYVTIYLVLFLTSAVCAKCLHNHPTLSSVLPEAGMVILIGILAGLVANLFQQNDIAQSMLSFSPTVFFVVLLPPIIFNSGYHVRRDLFFRYITPICLYACLGTFICTVCVAGLLYCGRSLFSFQTSFLELMAFGAVVSATDPVSTLAVFSSQKVDPQLFYLVFGESVINDAVGLVLFEALSHLITLEADGNALNVGEETLQFLFDFFTGFVGSLALGTILGVLFAKFYKNFELRDSPLLELCIYVTAMYFPFVMAEILHLSGIVTVLFTGIALKRYCEPNLRQDTANHADAIFRLTSHVTETVIFLELGLSVVGLTGSQSFHLGFIAAALAACLVGRALNVYPLTLIYNTCKGCYIRRENAPSEFSIRNGEFPTSTEYIEHASLEKQELGASASTGVVKASSSEESVKDEFVPWTTAHMLWFSGLRGAVSYALVRTFPGPNQNTFVVSTMFIVLLTTFVLGGGTKYALDKLGIPVNVDEAKFLNLIGRKRLLGSGFMRRIEESVRCAVVRDPMLKKSDNQSGSTDDSCSDDDVYEEHVELTEDEYMNTLSKGKSVYDFGQ